MESLHWHIFNDHSKFDGMSKDAVRDHFDAWVHGGADQSSGDHPFPITYTASLPRYRYCLQVDAVSVAAIANKDYDKPHNDAQEVGFVNLIKCNWEADPDRRSLMPQQAYYPEDEEDEDEDEDENENDEDEQLPEIDGSKDYDVGWMKVLLFKLAPGLYSSLMWDDMWDAYYARPLGFPRIGP